MKVSYKQLYTKVRFIPKYPLNLQLDKFQENLISENYEGSNIKEIIITNGLLNSYGVVSNSLFIPFKSTIYPNPKFKKYNYFISAIKSVIFQKYKTIDEPIGLFHHAWFNNYYHWLIEMIPRLFAILKDNPSLRIVIHENTPKYCSQILDVFNISNATKLQDGYLYKFKELHTATFQNIIIKNIPGSTGSYYVNIKANPELLRNTCDYIKNKLSINNKISNRKLFISRAGASKRKIINEQVLTNELVKKGYEIIKPENLPFTEQVKLFSEASIVIGPNGAGFANIIFMKPNSSVVNLMDEGLNEWCYLTLSSIFNLSYYQINCKGHGPGTPWSRDISVNLSDIMSLITKHENEKSINS